MKPFIKLPVIELNTIFSHLMDLESKVFWVRNPDYSQQVYVSPGYEKIWGRACEQLYQYPFSFNETISTEHPSHVVADLCSRKAENQDIDRVAYYCIRDLNNKILWIKDSCFYLFDEKNQQIAVAGIAESILQNQWECESQSKNRFEPSAQSEAKKAVEAILSNEYRLTCSRSANKTKPLTQREMDCLHYLSLGQTAKQIARQLDISVRTVETHIDNIKKKFECRTRMELLAKGAKGVTDNHH